MMRKSIFALLVPVVCALLLAAVLLAVSSSVDRRALLHTGLLAAGVCLLSLPMALLTAVTCLTRGRLPRCLWVTCLCLLFMPLFVQVSAWDSAFGKLGWLIHLTEFNGRFISAWLPAIWIHAMAAVPQVAIIVWFGLARSGWTCEDQASLEVGSFHVFWHITLPRILPLVLAGIVWVTIVCAREIAVTDIYRIGTVAEQIYLGYSLGEFDGAGNALLPVFGMVPSLAVMVLISAVAVIAIFNYPDNYFQSRDWKPDRMPVGQARHVVISTVMLVILIIVPMASLVARASKAVELVDGTPLVQYSWLNLASVVSHVPVRYVAEFQWSTGLALLSSVASMLLAVGMAWKACESRRWTGVMFVLVAITSGIPGPLIGSALLDARALFDFPFWHWLFDRTILAPVMANLVFCWPVVSLLVWVVLRSTAKGALESARLEGATSFVRLVRIAVASNLLPLIGCWLLVFAISFGELSASQLAIPPGIDTIPRRMLGLLHAGVNNETAGLTIVVFALVILVCVAGWQFVRWFGWRNSP